MNYRKVLIYFLWFLLFVSILDIASAEENKKVNELLVDNFNAADISGLFFERENLVGGYFGTWAQEPSYAKMEKVTQEAYGAMGQSLKIEFRKEIGKCGWYTLLNDLDATPFNAVSFYIKGAKGKEKFDIGFTDQKMLEFEIEPFNVGIIDDFLKDGVSCEWQKVIVPISSLTGLLDTTQMGSLVFMFNYEGSGAIFIDEIKFINDSKIYKEELKNMPQAKKDKRFQRYMWIWKVDPMGNTLVRDILFKFCTKTAIEGLYVDFSNFKEAIADENYRLLLKDFMQDAKDLNLKIYAVSGNPTLAFSANHKKVLDWLEAVLNFNRAENIKIDGVQFDIEVHLSRKWKKDKKKVIDDYLKLLKECSIRVAEYKKETQADFKLTVVIPVSYIDVGGDFEKKILENVDQIVLMDYFDDLESIIWYAEPHLKLASSLGKEVIVAVETQDLVKERRGSAFNTFYEEGWQEMEGVLEKAKEEFLKYPAFKGYGIHYFSSYRFLPKEARF
jgi:hypothetical protein